MKTRRAGIAVITLLLNALLDQVAYGSVISTKRGCHITVDWLEQRYGPLNRVDEYFCQTHSKSRQYYVFRMTARNVAPPDVGPDLVGSNLMGYFAVSRKDGKLFEWNLGDEVIGQELKKK